MAQKSNSTNFVDYRQYKRDNWFHRDVLRLQTVRFKVPSVEIIEHTKPLEAEYEILAREEAQNVGLRFEVRDEMGDTTGDLLLVRIAFVSGNQSLYSRV